MEPQTFTQTVCNSDLTLIFEQEINNQKKKTQLKETQKEDTEHIIVEN